MDIIKKKVTFKQYYLNEGLQLLRIILCFWIVCVHTCHSSYKLLNNILFKRQFHVSGFIIISFYFFNKIISQRDIHKVKQRFIRLLLPYFIIPSIIWIFNNLSYIFTSFNRFGIILKLIELINQFITGFVFHLIFWFQFVMIFLSVLFLIISFTFKENYLIIIQILAIISLILQYSGYNFKFFYKYKSNTRLGSIVEICVPSVIGLSFGAINLIKILQKYRLRIIFLCSLFLYFIYKYDIFKTIKGINYPGILFSLGGMLLFIIFPLIFTMKNSNKYILIIIKFCSNCILS